eukprot:1159215-Pelagomonas_calceolata.AAC.10
MSIASGRFVGAKLMLDLGVDCCSEQTSLTSINTLVAQNKQVSLQSLPLLLRTNKPHAILYHCRSIQTSLTSPFTIVAQNKQVSLHSSPLLLRTNKSHFILHQGAGL